MSNTLEDWDRLISQHGRRHQITLLSLASIYDERIFIQSSKEKGGQFNVFLELPKLFKLRIQSRYLSRSNKSRTHEGGNGAQETGSVELLTVEYLPPIVLNFRFPEDYASKSPPLFTLSCKWLTVFVWLTQSVNHTMPGPKIFIPGFVTVNRAPVTWFTIVKDRLQSTLG